MLDPTFRSRETFSFTTNLHQPLKRCLLSAAGEGSWYTSILVGIMSNGNSNNNQQPQMEMDEELHLQEQQQQQLHRAEAQPQRQQPLHRAIVDCIARLEDARYREERHRLVVNGGHKQTINRQSLQHLVDFLDNPDSHEVAITDVVLANVGFISSSF
jgi:hypothetical protein